MKKVVDCVTNYYIEKDYNCAETILLAAGEAWEMNLPEDASKYMAGFGGGMGCAIVCGAVTGGTAALSYKFVNGTGHKSPELMKMVRTFIKNVRMELGGENCSTLHPKYATKEERCLPTIKKVAEILDRVYDEN